MSHYVLNIFDLYQDMGPDPDNYIQYKNQDQDDIYLKTIFKSLYDIKPDGYDDPLGPTTTTLGGTASDN